MGATARLLVCVVVLLAGCGQPDTRQAAAGQPEMASDTRPGPVRAVNWKVDLTRYSGKWYEIAYYPARFSEGCTATTAEYALREDGRLACVNRCRDERPTGKARSTEGVGRVVDPATNAKLRFTYYLVFKGDYWIIDLDPEYRWAVVSDPKRKTLFIRSRTPRLDPQIYAGILERLAVQGFDLERIERTVWPESVADPSEPNP